MQKAELQAEMGESAEGNKGQPSLLLLLCQANTGCSNLAGYAAESREGHPGETSVDIAKALGHPPAAGANLSSLAEHPSPVSSPAGPASNQGNLLK